jgi:TatD DNase family protein
MLTDSHCHLASHRFKEHEVSTLIEAARAAGVGRLVTLVTSLGDLHANLAIADDPMVHTCIGIHPCDVHHAPDDAIQQLSAFTGDPRVCAIGETGLDYYHPAPDGWEEPAFRERQLDFLRQHFDLAAASGLNLVIHTRDQTGHASFEDALKIYGDYHTSVCAVFHCFIGPWENAKRVLDLGGLVSFGGVSTFKNAREVRETASQCPAGSFMVETDAPYLAPEPHRGKRNEPAYVRQTAEFLATLRGETLQEFASHTGETAARFFRFRSGSN